MNAKIETLFACLIVLQFAVVVSHDWLDTPGWTHGRPVQAVVGRGKLALATAVNAVFPALAVGSALWFWGRSEPKIVVDYWVIYCGLTLLSAIIMWYVPYFFGADERRKASRARTLHRVCVSVASPCDASAYIGRFEQLALTIIRSLGE